MKDEGAPEFLQGECLAIEPRGLTDETCRLWQYQVGEDRQGNACHIANYRDAAGKLVGQKVRKAGKDFRWIGGGNPTPLYGMWLWGSGKSIVITEGEIDALTVSQCFDNKWPVVSIPNGAGKQTAKALVPHYEYLDRFEKIVLMFDQDEPGALAVQEAAAVLPIGKVHIAVLPAKDANQTLLDHGKAAVAKAYWNAKPWRPDGIIEGSELTREQLMQPVTGYKLPYPKLDEMTGGLRKGELTLLTAGTGIGKSTWARELAVFLHETYGCKIGNVFLEESNKKTAQAYVAIDNNVPLSKLRRNPKMLPDEAWDASLARLIHNRMWFYDHFGSLDSVNLVNKLRYLATVPEVDFAILDHISIVTSGQESSKDGERKDIDILMTRLRSLVEETGVGIIGIVHLNQPEGTPHEEGGRVTLRNLRGSGSLKQLADAVWALERNQQGESPTEAAIRVLKGREVGETGPADTLVYHRDTGRLLLREGDASPFQL